MAISGDVHVGVFATLSPRRTHSHHLRSSTHSPSPSSSSSKAEPSGFLNGALSISETAPKRLTARCQSNLTFGVTEADDEMSIKSISQDAQTFLLNAIHMSFLDRLSLAWKIIFPPQRIKKPSDAMIAKQRLKMILFSDRCAVSEESKRRIVKSIVGALSDFVEIESQEKVQLSVSADTDIGTVYSVTVPVRRVKPEYQEADDGVGSIVNIEYKDGGESLGEDEGEVDVRFDFYVPNENPLL